MGMGTRSLTVLKDGNIERSDKMPIDIDTRAIYNALQNMAEERPDLAVKALAVLEASNRGWACGLIRTAIEAIAEEQGITGGTSLARKSAIEHIERRVNVGQS